MFNRDALFGKRQEAPPGQRAPPPRQQHDPYGQERKAPPPADTRRAAPPPSRRMQLKPMQSPDKALIYSNICAVSQDDFPPRQDHSDYLLILKGQYVVSARPLPVPRGSIALNEFQRQWASITMEDLVDAEEYHLFAQSDKSYLNSMDVEIGFASRRETGGQALDQDELADTVTKVFRHQVFAPGQSFLLDFRGLKCKLTVKTVELVDLRNLKAGGSQETHPNARGLLIPETVINFYKDAKSTIQLKGSKRRAAAQSVIRPDFKFEDMGIGGLDKEFSDIFRRAFASRIFPPGLIESWGMQHVRGILLYGPPGTGKTLIAREIGKMLNAREPKIINGPEVLNKYVGQSEENIRKLFADAEKEQKEKGNESGLHIIIFDELDAVCKQRGSGAGGGTGVGDSVVNQLLSKLDGVDQLNNILLIGMTNRKDMIDEALLRPGRLEVHMEISLPDESGRQQILKIHTSKMKTSGGLDPDVDLVELAKRTRNFSGAEINGLVRAAGSFAMQRHTKAGTNATPSDDLSDMKVTMADFVVALQEVKPLFGANDEGLKECVKGGIIHFGEQIDKILNDGRVFSEMVRSKDAQLLPVLLHGPRKSGKTALAAQIALTSQIPFMKMVRPVDMAGMNELQKVQTLVKAFEDAHKSPISLLVLDDIEDIIEWNHIGPRFSNTILGALKGLMKKTPPQERSLLILATTSERTSLHQMRLLFDVEIPVPNLQSQPELAHVMQKSGQFDNQEINSAIQRIEEAIGSQDIGVGIWQIMFAITRANKDGEEDRVGKFVELMCEAIYKARE